MWRKKKKNGWSQKWKPGSRKEDTALTQERGGSSGLDHGSESVVIFWVHFVRKRLQALLRD